MKEVQKPLIERALYRPTTPFDPDIAEVILFSKEQKCFHSELLSEYLKDTRGHTHRQYDWDFKFVDISHNGLMNCDQLEYYTNLFFKQGLLEHPYYFDCDCSEYREGFSVIDKRFIKCNNCEKILYDMDKGLDNG
jgi:hypothetical protein